MSSLSSCMPVCSKGYQSLNPSESKWILLVAPFHDESWAKVSS